MAEKTWILVAHRAGARIYENAGAGTGLTLVRKIDHPAGKGKNQDINADRPGRAYDSEGAGRHAMGKQESPMEHEDANFARELAKVLDHGRGTNAFKHIVIVAGPRQLGLIRDSLDKHTAAMISASLDVDLPDATDAEVASRLSGTVTL
jgi:protein required for attachment to host cells